MEDAMVTSSLQTSRQLKHSSRNRNGAKNGPKAEPGEEDGSDVSDDDEGDDLGDFDGGSGEGEVVYVVYGYMYIARRTCWLRCINYAGSPLSRGPCSVVYLLFFGESSGKKTGFGGSAGVEGASNMRCLRRIVDCWLNVKSAQRPMQRVWRWHRMRAVVDVKAVGHYPLR